MSLKKKITLIILLLSSAFSISMGVCFAHYTHKDPINDYYNNQIITDFAFKAKDTMTEQQIQQFLADKGSALTNYTIPTDGSVSTMIGPGDSVNGSGWTASKVIYMAAQWYELNPQVILATLQKESSLVTSGNLNYVNTAMGYACSESSPCSPSYFGFARQIDWASWQLGYYNFHYSELKDTSRAGQYYVGNTAVIDGKNTYISNSATAALYRYTPHRPDSAWLTATDGNHYYGNYNFIYFYSHWFNFADVIRTSVKSNPGVDFEKSNIFLGENVVGNMTLKNSSDVGIDLNNIVVITINKSTGKQTDLLYASHTFAAEGQEGDTFTSQIPFNPKEAGEYKFLVMTCYNNEWISLSDYTYVNVTKPNIKTTWSLVPSKAAVSTPVTPQLKVKNFESVPITLEAVGTAVWYQWPQPKDRSFEYQSNVTIPANTELTINIPAKTFTEIGSYGYWPIYKIAGNWYQLEHITGWSTFGWMEIQG